MPELRARYADRAAELFRTAPAEPAADFAAQFAKVGGRGRRAVGCMVCCGCRARARWIGCGSTKWQAPPQDQQASTWPQLPHRSLSHPGQLGVALLSGKTDAAAPVQGVGEEMSYEREVVTTEGGLEAETHVRACPALRLLCAACLALPALPACLPALPATALLCLRGGRGSPGAAPALEDARRHSAAEGLQRAPRVIISPGTRAPTASSR